MKIHEFEEGDVLVLAPDGSVLGREETSVLEATIGTALKAGTRRIVLDCTDVRQLCTPAIRVLLRASLKLRGSEGRLVLCGMGPEVGEAFSISGLNKTLVIVSKRDEAVRRVGEPDPTVPPLTADSPSAEGPLAPTCMLKPTLPPVTLADQAPKGVAEPESPTPPRLNHKSDPSATAREAAVAKPHAKGLSKAALAVRIVTAALVAIAATQIAADVASTAAMPLPVVASADQTAIAKAAASSHALFPTTAPRAGEGDGGASWHMTMTDQTPSALRQKAPVDRSAGAPQGRRGGTSSQGRRGGTSAPGRGESPSGGVREKSSSERLEDARKATIKGDYLTAIAELETILAQNPNYPGAAGLLALARDGAKNASQFAVDEGNQAEVGADYADAMKHYERALLLDPQSATAPDAIRRLKTRMQVEGEGAYKSAKQYDAIGRVEEATALYERSIRLLPPSHASATAARERVEAIKGGR